ncbi:hypothetical protein [Mycobacterium intracellulare]|uniref:hypothetical protein n=1 Tax=Mycobacterium intracellulare TaxID=1767 RepID=UPI000B21A83D|nr:hypothetical protein [Mycobacterium intracellulare]
MKKRLYIAATAVITALLITLVLAPALVGHLLIALFVLVVQAYLDAGDPEELDQPEL